MTRKIHQILTTFEINPSLQSLHAMSRQEDRTQLTANFNDLTACYSSSATVVCTLQIFEKKKKEICTYVPLEKQRLNSTVGQVIGRETSERKKKKEKNGTMLKNYLLLYMSVILLKYSSNMNIHILSSKRVYVFNVFTF